MVADISHIIADGSRLDTSRTTGEEEKEKIVEITWRDILQSSGWEKSEDVNAPQFKSVGWLVSQDETQIKIASTLDYAATFGDSKDEAKPVAYGITAFPPGCVEYIKFI